MSSIVTAKVPKRLKEEAKKYSINISKVVREALEREIMKRKIEEAKKLQKKVNKISQKIDQNLILEVIKEIRYGE